MRYRDANFTAAFDAVFPAAGVRIISAGSGAAGERSWNAGSVAAAANYWTGR